MVDLEKKLIEKYRNLFGISKLVVSNNTTDIIILDNVSNTSSYITQDFIINNNLTINSKLNVSNNLESNKLFLVISSYF